MNSAIRTWLLKVLLRLFLRMIVISALFSACFELAAYGQHPSSSIRATGTISDVRRVLRGMTLCTTRYSRIHDFDVYFSVRTGQQRYCADYETIVLDEIKDLENAEGKDLEIVLNEKKNNITLYTPQNRKLKARIVRSSHCSSFSLAKN